MESATIAQVILAAAQLAKSVAPLVEKGVEVFGSDDAAKIKAAADELRAANEGLHARVQAKLRG